MAGIHFFPRIRGGAVTGVGTGTIMIMITMAIGGRGAEGGMGVTVTLPTRGRIFTIAVGHFNRAVFPGLRG